MEQAQMTTENLRNVMATVDAMQTANKEMKKQYKNVDLDKIDVSTLFLLDGSIYLTFQYSNYRMKWKT